MIKKLGVFPARLKGRRILLSMFIANVIQTKINILQVSLDIYFFDLPHNWF